MDAKTLKALKGSIKKWELIVVGKGADMGDDNCPLCKLFFNNHQSCRGCPVAEKSGQGFCNGTPYDKWREVLGSETRPHMAYNAERKKIARAELKFLKSLLP